MNHEQNTSVLRSTPTSDPLLTLLEIAHELRCSKAHVSHLINGTVAKVPALPFLSLGRRKLIRRGAFEHWKKLCESASNVTLPTSASINAVGA
jgi:hypothetical protein